MDNENKGLPVEGKRSDAVPGRAAKPPVEGYQPQSDEMVRLVNANKVAEEIFLRRMDDMKGADEIDQRWLAIARTNIEQGFMALNRAIFRPGRIELDGDTEKS